MPSDFSFSEKLGLVFAFLGGVALGFGMPWLALGMGVMFLILGVV